MNNLDELITNEVESKIEVPFVTPNFGDNECIESAPSGSSTDTVSYEDVVECLKDCYPLNKIK